MNNSAKKVAVVIPCYNAQETLAETLDCVLAQTFEDFCIIAVNDGSQDKTAEVLADFSVRYPDKFQVYTQVNQGQTVAKNVGIRSSQSEYIAFLDSDDLWAPDKLANQVTLLDDNANIGMCYTAAKQIDVASKPVGDIRVSLLLRGRCSETLIKGNNIVASSVLARRTALEQAGLYDEAFRACENWDLWIRIARDWEVEPIDMPLTSYRVHPNNMSKNNIRMLEARLQVVNKHLPESSTSSHIQELRKQALFKTHFAFAKSYIESLNLSEARQELLKAMKLKPASSDCYVLYLKTLLGPGFFRWVRNRRNGSV